jgi:hypothetical protein
MHGYANDFCCYIPSERLLKEGGYGGGGEINYFGLPTTLKAGLEDKIVAEVHRQIPAQFRGKQAGPAEDAAGKITKLVDGLAVGTPAEYERIPEIWRVAVEGGKRNNDDELRRLLELAVPKLDEPATHWQVVVCGGGIVHGLSQQGEAILASFEKYTEENRKLAIDALLRNGERRAMLQDAIADGRIPASALTAEQADKLKP